MLNVFVLKNFCFWNQVVSYSKILNKKFLFLEASNIYFLIPNCLFLKKVENFFFFFFFSSIEDSFNIFFEFFVKIFKRLSKINRCKIVFSGLGFRVSFISSNILSFKIGLSHLVILEIPKGIDIILVKNNIYVKSFNPSLLGSFVNRIKNLKYPDSYKGKGFWFQTEKKNLKVMKKS